MEWISRYRIPLIIAGVTLCALAATSILTARPQHRVLPARFALIQDGAPEWFELSGTTLTRISAPPASAASSTPVVTIDSHGLVRVDQSGARHTLLNRPGISEGTSAIAPDAERAVLANPVTGSIDAFSIGPGAFATSYIGSVPVAPDAIAFVSPTEFVAHDAAGYELYTIGKSAVSKTAVLTLK